MYVSIGGDLAVRERAVIGVFDLDNASCGRDTRDFLARAEQAGEVVSVTDELPRTFVLTEEYGMRRVWLTQFSSRAVERRARRHVE